MVTGRYHFVLCRILEHHFALKSDRLRVSVLDCRLFPFFYQTIHFSMFCVILVVDNLMIKSFIENMTCYLTKNLGVLLQI